MVLLLPEISNLMSNMNTTRIIMKLIVLKKFTSMKFYLRKKIFLLGNTSTKKTKNNLTVHVIIYVVFTLKQKKEQ